MEDNKPLNYEVNFLTEEKLSRAGAIQAIEAEFKLIQLWQSMSLSFGSQARDILDCFMALSLRKMLCDEDSILLKLCSDFKMPKLQGHIFSMPDMKLTEIHPQNEIAPRDEWVPVTDWLKQKIAWIDKGISDIPDSYEDSFFRAIVERIGDRHQFETLFECVESSSSNKTIKTWVIKDKIKGKERAFELLKNKGYYDLTIRKMIKHIADKNGAHIDDKSSLWVRVANTAEDHRYSAISIFASQMICAAANQISELSQFLSNSSS